jgi:hypothetical protein
LDTQEKDLGGAIIANGETPPATLTNGVAPPTGGDEKARNTRAETREQLARGGTNSPEIMERFDADHDGKLNESELANMRHWALRHPGTNGSQHSSLN